MSYKIGEVSSARLASDSVTGAKIADDSIGSEHLDDASVLAAAVATDAIVADAIAAGAVSESELSDDAVATAKIADAAVTGAKLAANLTYGSNLTISGNLTVEGSQTIVESTTLEVHDKQIVIAKENSSSAPLDGSGLVFEGGSGNDLHLTWDATGEKLEFKDSADAYKGIKAGTFTGALAGNATSADAWASAVTLSLAGDLSGSVSIDGSGDATLTGTIAANSVALSTDTVGDYVESMSGSTGITVSNGNGEGSTPSLSLATPLADISQLAQNDGAFIVSDGTTFTAESGATALTSLGVSAYAQTILDDANAAASRTTLGLGSAAESDTGDFFAASDVSAFGATLFDDANAAAARTTLELVPGTNVQAYHANLASAAGLSVNSGDKIITMNPGGFSATLAIGDFSNANSGTVRQSVGSDDGASTSATLSGFTAYYMVDMNNRSSFTLTLPAITASDTGRKIEIKAGSSVAAAKPFTIQGNTGQTVDGGTVTLNEAYQAITLVAMSDGGVGTYDWYIF